MGVSLIGPVDTSDLVPVEPAVPDGEAAYSLIQDAVLMIDRPEGPDPEAIDAIPLEHPGKYDPGLVERARQAIAEKKYDAETSE